MSNVTWERGRQDNGRTFYQARVGRYVVRVYRAFWGNRLRWHAVVVSGDGRDYTAWERNGLARAVDAMDASLRYLEWYASKMRGKYGALEVR